MANIALNPQLVKAITEDIVKQLSFHYDKAKALPQAVKSLKGITDAKSWGDLATRATAAVKKLGGAKTGDVIPHIKTRYRFYTAPGVGANEQGVLPKEFVPAAGTGLKTVIGTGAGLGAVAGAAALGAGAIGYNWYKHNKEVEQYTKESLEWWDDIIKIIKNKKSNKEKTYDNQ